MTKRVLTMLAAIILIMIMVAPCAGNDKSIVLSEEEALFIRDNPVIRVGVDPLFVPFEFIDRDDVYKGISADYLALISERTGLNFEIIKGLSWPEAYDKALNGEIKLLPAISKTSDREQHFIFSSPYYYFKRVIVTRDTDTGISDIGDLVKSTVAVQRNSSHHSYLLSFSNINLSLYDSVESALTAVANGTERAFVGNLATTNYLIRSNGLTNLRFTAFEADKQQAIYMAVSKDMPVLAGIINKALDTVTEEEKMQINNKWIDLGSEKDYGPVIRIIAIVAVIVLIILIVSVYWIIRLRNEVKKREIIQQDLEKAKREANEANEYKSSFMARMSHEIRTPLNAISGMAYLLKKTDLSMTQRTYAERITQASANMLGIINDILDFSKIEAGKVELEIGSFSLDQVIQDVVNIVSYKIEEQKIGFKLSKDPYLPDWFYGDAKRIEQVLVNILNNAAKFTSAGEVSLEIRLVAKEQDKYHLSFTVKDTGIGMTKEQADKLFMPFVQGDVSINRRFGGSGLGLSIVKTLLDMMGGQVRVFSTPNEGSTFVIHLTLPVDKQKEDEYAKRMSKNQFKDIKVLVIERSGASMNLIESYLSSFGMHCELTSSQSSALAMLQTAGTKFSRPFDLAIVDYDTLDENAFLFIDSIRKNEKIVKKPRVIMLLPMMREDLFDVLNAHGVDFGIGKPIIPSVLYNGIIEIFSLKAVSAVMSSRKEARADVDQDKRHCVLVAEDNKTNQLIAGSLLEQAGIDTIFADDGKAAVELYNTHANKIDLILMDLHMPVMNGYEAADKIRGISTNVPIVAMTADVILGVRENCEKHGIHHYISKPFDPDNFIRTVKEIMALDLKDSDDSDITVLDMTAGLSNMGGDEDIYIQVLKEYLAENRDTAALLESAVRAEKYEDAVKIVHKVKGSSGSIGAGGLYEICIALQKALAQKDEENINKLTENFMTHIGKIIDRISLL